MGEQREQVGRHYAQVAEKLASQGGSKAGNESQLYGDGDLAGVSAQTASCSKGCGTPITRAQPQVGEQVLDLGSGAGLDALVCARQVGPAGHVWGLDMTDEMIGLARRNAEREGASNVSFVKGFIEDIPLASGSMDVVTSNCVINLSEDRRRALSEAFRVLKPGGRLVIADLVLLVQAPAEVDAVVRRILGCTLGAFTEQQYRDTLFELGFVDVAIDRIKTYQPPRLHEKAADKGLESELAAIPDEQIAGLYESAFIEARKPQG